MTAGDVVMVSLNPSAVIGWYTFTPALGVEVCIMDYINSQNGGYFGLDPTGYAGNCYNYSDNTAGGNSTAVSRNSGKNFCTNAYPFFGYGDWTIISGIQIK